MSTTPARIRPHHALTIIVTAVIAVILAYWVLGWLAGVIVFLVKTVVVLGIIALAVWLVLRWAGSTRR
jgi:uncharacterized membrane protein